MEKVKKTKIIDKKLKQIISEFYIPHEDRKILWPLLIGNLH